MKIGSLYSRLYSIGGKPSIRVFCDSMEIFRGIELVHDDKNALETNENILSVFILSKSFEKLEFDLFNIPSGKIVFSHPNVKIYNIDGVKIGHWYGKASSLTNAQSNISVINYPGYRYYLTSFFYRMIFRPIIDTMLSNIGYLLFHASAVAKDGFGWIFAGETGTGKSTITKELVAAGFSFLGDDRAVLHRTKPLDILSYPEYICFTKNGSSYKKKSRAYLDIESVTVNSIVLIEKSNENVPFKIIKLGTAEAAARFIHFSRISVDEKIIGKEKIDHISEICQKSDCYLLSGSGTIQEKIRIVKKLTGERK